MSLEIRVLKKEEASEYLGAGESLKELIEKERQEVEDRRQTELLQEKLSVKRPFYSRAVDWIRDLTLSDIWCNKGKVIAGLAVIGVLCYLPFGEKARRKNLAEIANSRKPDSALRDVSLTESYSSEMQQAAGLTGTPSNVLDAILYAVQNSPEYVAEAKASGRAGLIPLNPFEVGIRPEILEKDTALCLRAAAELYRQIRATVDTDVGALTIFFSSFDDYQKAMDKARRSEIEHSSFQLEDYKGQLLRNHEVTLELIEKHKKGELSDFDYWHALVKGTPFADMMPYCLKKGKWKSEFENAISEDSSPPAFKIAPADYPYIRVLSDSYYGQLKADFDSFEDFTIHLPPPVREAVSKARAYLNQ